MKNETNHSKKDGMPDIAEDIKRKKPIVLAAIGVVMAVVFSMYFFTKSQKKPPASIEDTYIVQTESQIDTKKPLMMTGKTAALAASPVSQEILQQQMALIQEKQKELQQRLMAPLMLVNTNSSSGTAANTQATQTTKTISNDANTQFMNQVSGQASEVTTATTIGPLNEVIAEGNFIHAILESATNSDLPGSLRATVSAPVYSEDGTNVLIPAGSRLIGQYKSGMLQGQSRIFVVWTRLITPDGISIQLGSSGVDSLGVAGMGADEIDRHFWQRFGTASLLSLLGAGAANVGVNEEAQDNSASAYRSAVANSFAQSAGQSLQQQSMIAPTLKTYQGKPIIVFVARDLYFKNAMKQTRPKINIF